MLREQAAVDAASKLNAGCRCVNVEVAALRRAVEARVAALGLPIDLALSHPHLFSQVPVFLSAPHARRMADTVRAVEKAVALPAFREAALAWAPPVALHDSGTAGAFLGFDFHLSAEGPKLIEINTNAGGGFLAAMLGDAALACCGTRSGTGDEGEAFERRAAEMLCAEWRRAGRGGRPRAIAIVDQDPRSQYLYPEFLLAQRALGLAGLETLIVSPDALQLRGDVLYAGDTIVDLVYNRLTDFALDAPALAPLREAYLRGIAVVTPNPRAHALYADKRVLGLLGNPARLRSAGLDEQSAALLGAVVPRTAIVQAHEHARWWAERRRHFFKPFAGHGSRGAYRGDKLTRRVFEEILRGGYVAQELVSPGERAALPEGSPLKFDLRNFAYGGEVQQVAARLWQGQTTNFRSAGGGFAPVLVLP